MILLPLLPNKSARHSFHLNWADFHFGLKWGKTTYLHVVLSKS